MVNMFRLGCGTVWLTSLIYALDVAQGPVSWKDLSYVIGLESDCRLVALVQPGGLVHPRPNVHSLSSSCVPSILFEFS